MQMPQLLLHEMQGGGSSSGSIHLCSKGPKNAGRRVGLRDPQNVRILQFSVFVTTPEYRCHAQDVFTDYVGPGVIENTGRLT
jgi:hypothetical protein